MRTERFDIGGHRADVILALAMLQLHTFRADAKRDVFAGLCAVQHAGRDAESLRRTGNTHRHIILGRLDRDRSNIHHRTADKLRDEEITRLQVNLLWRADLLQNSVMHDDDAVGERHGLDLVMGHINAG